MADARGRVLPEAPAWLDELGYCGDGPPAYYLAIGEWLALPLRHHGATGRTFSAVSVLVADRRDQEVARAKGGELALFANRLRVRQLLDTGGSSDATAA